VTKFSRPVSFACSTCGSHLHGAFTPCPQRLPSAVVERQAQVAAWDRYKSYFRGEILAAGMQRPKESVS
jgi:hypothetical protein